MSKHNWQAKHLATTAHAPRYALRKLNVGLVSVALGTVFFFAPGAFADTTRPTDQPPVPAAQAENQSNVTTSQATQQPTTPPDPSSATPVPAAPVAVERSVQAATPAPAVVTDTGVEQITLNHGQDTGQRVVKVTSDATSGDVFTINVPYIFTATNNANGTLFSAETTLTPVAQPAYTTDKSLFDTTFTYHIKNVNGNISFNVNLFPQLADWGFIQSGTTFALTVARNERTVGQITYTIGEPAQLTGVNIAFDHNQTQNLLTDQTYMVGIRLPNDGGNDGDNFTGTVTLTVPDGFTLDDTRANGYVPTTTVGDNIDFFNTLGSPAGLTFKQAGAGQPITIDYNRGKAELNHGFFLIYGHYTKQLSAQQNVFTATATATSTNAQGEKANYPGALQTISGNYATDLAVEQPARDRFNAAFATGEPNIYRDQVTATGAHQSDDSALAYGAERRLEVINSGNNTQHDVVTHLTIEPGTVLPKIGDAYGVKLNSSAVNHPQAVVATLTDGTRVVIPISAQSYANTTSLGYVALITAAQVEQGLQADGSNIAALDVTYANLEPGTKFEISFSNNGIITEKRAGAIADYSYTISSANGAAAKGSQAVPIADPVGFQRQFTGIVNFQNADYQPNSENGGNQAKINYVLQETRTSDEASTYMIEIPQGFTVDPTALHLYQNGREVSGGTIEYLGTVGAHGEQTFMISLPFTPYYGIPVFVKDAKGQDLTLTAIPNQAPANYAYAPANNDTNPLIAEIITDRDKFTPVSFQAFQTITRGDRTFTILGMGGFAPNWVKYSFSYASTYSSFDSIRSNGAYVMAPESVTTPPQLNYINTGQIDNTTGKIKLITYLSDLGTADYSYNLVNLPSVADNDPATLTLTGPGTISENRNAENVQLLYSLTRVDQSGALTAADLATFVSADQIQDWAAVKAVLLKAGTLTSPVTLTAELPFQVTALRPGVNNSDVTIKTNFTGFHNAVTHSNSVLVVNVQRYVNVTTRWVDDDTQTDLAPSTTKTYQAGTTYQTNAKPAELNPNYELVKVDGDRYGVTGDQDVTVTYHYRAKQATATEEKQLTRIINYVIDGGDDAVKAPNPVRQTVTLSRTVTTNLVTGKVVKGDWTTAAWDAVTSPELKGYHPDLGEVAAQTVTADTADTTVTVHYTKNATAPVPETRDVTRTIKYVVDDGGAVAPTTVTQTVHFTRTNVKDTVTGEIVQTGDWTASSPLWDAVTSPELKGYHPNQEKVAEETVTADTKNITVTVHYIKNGTASVTENKDVTRTIKYVVDDGGVAAPATVTQTVHFTRTNVKDAVTGEVVQTGDWTASSPLWIAVTSPTLQGYHPDQKKVADETVTADTKNTTVEVRYTKNATVPVPESKTVTRTIQYVVDDGGAVAPTTVTQMVHFTRTNIKDTVTGEIVQTGDWTASSPLWIAVTSPMVSGYHPDQKKVAEQTVTVDMADTTVTVHYTKNDTESVTENKDVTRTIQYVVDDGGATAPEPVTQTVHFTRTNVKDTVTGQVVQTGNWTASSPLWIVVTSPTITSYHPDLAEVAERAVTADTKDVTVMVHYLKNGTESVTENKDVTRTIQYVVDDGGAVVPITVTQTVHFTRTNVKDAVTGEVIQTGDWIASSAAWDAVDSPTIKGYHPDLGEVAAQAVSADTADTTVTVHYIKNGTVPVPESKIVTRTIKYVVDDGGAAAPATVTQTVHFTRTNVKDTVTGKVVQTGDWTASSPLWVAVISPTVAGYHPDLGEIAAQTVMADTADATVTVHYTKNATVTTTETKQVKRTINYVVAGNDSKVKAPSPVTQVVTFTRDKTVDQVTGQVVYTAWVPATTSWAAVSSPELVGYTPDVAVVPSLVVTTAMADQAITVTYTKQPGAAVPDQSTPTVAQPNPVSPKRQPAGQPTSVQPAHQLPQTGDQQSPVTLLGLGLAALGLGGVSHRRRKQNGSAADVTKQG